MFGNRVLCRGDPMLRSEVTDTDTLTHNTVPEFVYKKDVNGWN
jgi:hypothetical protein